MNGRGSSFLAVLVLLSLQTLSHAQTQFTAKLSGSQTVPPVSTTASGTGVFELTDEGLRFDIVIDGDALTGPITVAHFHNAAFGDAGNVVNTIGDDFDGNAASGVWSRTDPIEPLTPEFIDELFAGNIYVNIHTQANPAGEIRGQLVPSGRVAELDGEQTVPSVSTTANGIGYFELSAAGLSFKVTVAEDLLSGPITAAHFHNAPPGQAGGVVRTITNDFVGDTATGVWSGTDPEPLTAQLIDELRAGNIYVNIHTQANAAGEIRGQLEVPTLAAEFDDNQEMPPVQVGSLATGVGLFTLTPDGLRFNITIDTEKLTGPITNAHFHNAPPGAAGNVVRTIFDDLVGNVASGIWTATDPEPLTPELIDELLAGNIYVNVHTQANPPGEIRGQIVTPSLGAAVLPTSRSVQVGSSATAFASLVHAGSPAAVGCTIAPVTSVAADFLFQTTDPATNAPSGTADTAIDVPAAETQTFVMAFTPTAEFGATDVVLNFACDNASAAPSISGLNTLLLSASSVPVPDVVALAATLNNDGIVNIAGDTGTGVFSVATVNVGTTGQITASADDNGAGLPIVLSICETQPATGECLSPPESSVVTNIDANETPTFGIFVTGAGNVPFDPANNRVFVRFRDDAEETRGSTSVAARTQ